MSEVSAAVAEPAAPVTAPSSPGLLGGVVEPIQPPAAVANEPVAPVIPAQEPVGIEVPYWSRLIEQTPELKPYEKQLARFTETDPAKFAAVVAKSWAESTKFRGMNVPGADATPEDIAQYRKVNGIPAEAKDYKLGETLGEQFKAMGVEDPKLIDKYAEGFHKLNLTESQIKGLMEVHGPVVRELIASQTGAGEAARVASVEAYKAELGERFPVVLGDAQKLHDIAFAGAKLTESEQREMDQFSKSTAYVKMLASLGQRIPKESSIHSGTAAVFQGDASRLEQMKSAMAKDPKHPIMDPSHVDHASAMREFSELAARVKDQS